MMAERQKVKVARCGTGGLEVCPAVAGLPASKAGFLGVRERQRVRPGRRSLLCRTACLVRSSSAAWSPLSSLTAVERSALTPCRVQLRIRSLKRGADVDRPA
jgi:hypothetical protein